MNEPSEPSRTDDRIPHDRYTIVELLGRGGQGSSFLANDRETNSEVLVKRLSIGTADAWKSVELFERSIEVLQDLDHPTIPDYLDAFNGESEGEFAGDLYFVREFVEGRSLRERLEAGERTSEERARRLAEELFDILSYLHDREPPVVHRDIKPGNIIERPDGSVALVDFGTVQKSVVDEHVDRTVVGTAGYVPPEQLTGGASPASDLYAAGATLVHLLSHKPPSELPVHRTKIQFRDHLEVSEQFCQFLDRLLAPDPRERFNSATEALEALDRPELLVDESSKSHELMRTDCLPEPPAGSRLSIEPTDEGSRVSIPKRLELLWVVRAAGILLLLGVTFLLIASKPRWSLLWQLLGGFGFALFLLILGSRLPARHKIRWFNVELGGNDLVIEPDSVRIRELSWNESPERTLYETSLTTFPGLETSPTPDPNDERSVTEKRGAKPPAGERSEPVLAIGPDERRSERDLEPESKPKGPSTLDICADLTVAERQWIAEVVNETVEHMRSWPRD